MAVGLGIALVVCSASESSARTRTRSSSRRNRRQVAGANLHGYAGARYHTNSSVLPGLPFESGDLSWLLGVELHEQAAYWQALLGIARGVEGLGYDTRYVLTPQVNLLLKDRSFLGGIGILRSHIDPDVPGMGSGWSRTYYQFLLGYDFSTSNRTNLNIFVVYPFLRWSELSDFSGSDLEYQAGLSISF